MSEQPPPIGFESKARVPLIDNRYKIHKGQGQETYELYDLIAEPGETADIAEEHPNIVKRMKETLEA